MGVEWGGTPRHRGSRPPIEWSRYPWEWAMLLIVGVLAVLMIFAC